MNLTKQKTAAILATVAMVAALVLLYPRGNAHSDVETVQGPALTAQQEVWVQALRWCESRGNDAAINKMDRDGTPSYGRYQFKPSTYAYFAKKYGMASTTDYMNAEEQEQIVGRMILDEDVSDNQLRRQQFPDCIQRVVGLPPR